jgi:hypothetical protein
VLPGLLETALVTASARFGTLLVTQPLMQGVQRHRYAARLAKAYGDAGRRTLDEAWLRLEGPDQWRAAAEFICSNQTADAFADLETFTSLSSEHFNQRFVSMGGRPDLFPRLWHSFRDKLWIRVARALPVQDMTAALLLRLTVKEAAEDIKGRIEGIRRVSPEEFDVEYYHAAREDLDLMVRSGLYGLALLAAERLNSYLSPFRTQERVRAPLFEVRSTLFLCYANTGLIWRARTLGKASLDLAEEIGPLQKMRVVRDLGALDYAEGRYSRAGETLLFCQAACVPPELKGTEEGKRVESRLASEVACSLARAGPSNREIDRQLDIMRSHPSPEHASTEIEIALIRAKVSLLRKLFSLAEKAEPADVSRQALFAFGQAQLGWLERDLDKCQQFADQAERLIEIGGVAIMRPPIHTLKILTRIARHQLAMLGSLNPSDELILFALHPL